MYPLIAYFLMCGKNDLISLETEKQRKWRDEHRGESATTDWSGTIVHNRSGYIRVRKKRRGRLLFRSFL